MHKSLPSFFLPSLFIHLTGGNVLKIALYNLEPKIVNSAMMQVSAYHKSKGDQVYTYYPVLHDSYDRVYAFSIFTFTPKKYIKKNMIVGGTGFGPTIKLPEEIEEAPYDWSLYPDCDYSIAWFSRGCIRNCPFCIVREKKGYIHSVKPKNLNPNGKFIKVMDNNFFANPEWRQAINQLQEWNQKVDFQGVDVRLLTKEQCQALDSLKHYHQIKIAWDLPRDRNGRACAKPVKLYETIYKFLDSKKILDLFAGWGDSVIAAQNLGLHIDAYDIDQSLAERYNYLNSLSNKKQLTLREVSS